jgi:hypothetical protein
VKTLVAGWFSFEQMGASAGDLLARDLACQWLRSAGCPFDVALAPPFTGGVDWRRADASGYTHVLFVCGPIGNGPPVDAFLEKFHGRRMVGLNLTMLHRLADWNPFDLLLLERDSDRTVRPDIAIAAPSSRVPAVGLIQIDSQPEYGKNDLSGDVHAAFRRMLDAREASVVAIDTRLDCNATGLRTPGEIESLIAKMDVVMTTRLHGMVLALKTGVPPVAVDSVHDGGKVIRQARALGWPCVFVAADATSPKLREAFDWCLTPEARATAINCRDRAIVEVERIRETFVSTLSCR